MDPFIFFIDTVQGKDCSIFIHILSSVCFFMCQKQLYLMLMLSTAVQASDPARFQNLTRTLDFHYQALASGVAQHAEQRRVEIEKEKLEKAATQ